MASVKYSPAEIDGENQLEKGERLLVADDVTLQDLPQYQSEFLKGALEEIDSRLDSVESGVDFNAILTAYFSDTLIDFNGNVLVHEGF